MIDKRYKNILSGYSLAVMTTVLWSGNFIIARGLHESIPPIGLSFWRWLVATAVLFPFAYRFFIKDITLIRRHYFYLAVTALLGVTLFNTLIYIAGHTTKAINLSLLAAASPILILLFSAIFLKEKFTVSRITGITLSFVGIIFLISKGDLSQLSSLTFAVGDVWMLCAAMSFAAYTILVKKKPAELSNLAFLFAIYIFGLLFIFPAYLYEHFYIAKVTMDSSNVLAILYVSLFASIIAYYTWNRAVLSIGVTQSALIYFLTPVFSAIGANIILHEPILAVEIHSMMLILLGILLALHLKKSS